MFTAYIKYISLLLFSGLILTFYRVTLPSVDNAPLLSALNNDARHASFSLMNDFILPLFPVLNTGDLLR